MTVKIEKLQLGEVLELGEGPHWDSKSNLLYFVDIPKGKVYKYDPKTGKHASIKIGSDTTNVSMVVPVAGAKDKFLISIDCDLKILSWNGEDDGTYSLEQLAELEGKDSKNRINDGKCDPRGRVYAGTMGPMDPETRQFADGKGSLYNFESGKTANRLVEGVGISNGLAWSPDSKKFYYIDSMKFAVSKYDYSIDDGTIGNGRVIFDFKKNGITAFPDGMTIDSEGKLWVACFEGGKVIRIDPDSGDLLYELELPSYQITSVAFGGPDLDELYVTSAEMSQTSEIKQKYPDFGSVFRVTGLGVKGTPMYDFRM